MLYALIIAIAIASGDEVNAEVKLATLEELSTPAERIGLIDRFVHENYYNPAGLMFSHMRWDQERPFTASDFKPTDSTIMGPEPHEWMSYENSSFISGLFLAAQCFRYQATKDAIALEYAKRAFDSIDANYRLTENLDPSAAGPSQRAGIVDSTPPALSPRNGFFCKPYYGQANDHTSTEQHFGALFGLYHYQKYASIETQQRIKKIFSEVSRRWRSGYRINFFGEVWNLEESYPRAQRHMFTWAAIHRMAFEITQEPECLEEFKRLDALYGAAPTPRETSVGLGRPSYISTEDRSFHVQIVMGAEILAQLEPKNSERYLRSLRAWWEYSLLGQREDLKSYYFIRVNALAGSWEKLPPSIKPRSQWRSSFMLQNAILPICWLGTRERQGLTSAIMVHLFPRDSAAAHERLHAIFSDIRKEHLKWFADPENVMPDPLRWMLNVLQGDSLAFHSLGYWYARANDIEL